MDRTTPVLIQVIYERPVNAVSDSSFFQAVNQGLLLAVHEQGILTDVQLRNALEGKGSAI